MQSEVPTDVMEAARKCAGEWNLIDAIAKAILAERARCEAALSTDAEPVGFIVRDKTNKHGVFYRNKPSISDEDLSEFEICIDPVYASPPAPAVAVKAFDVEALIAEVHDAIDQYREGMKGTTFGPNEWPTVGGVKTTVAQALRRSALSAQVQDVAEYERREQVCRDTALSQWERSLKRPDLTEKDRVIGAVEAYKRQAFAFTMLTAAPAAKQGEAE